MQTTRSTAVVLALLAFLLGGCTRNQKSTQMDTTSIAPPPPTANANHGAMTGTPMSGNVAMDMKMMDSMMMQGLGAADSNYDDRFIAMMIPHHKGAIMMANQVLARSTRPELRQLAQGLISAQQKDITQMERWSLNWYGHAPDTTGQMAIMNSQMAKELGASGRDFDLDFLDAMIPHHEGAISMAENARKNSTHTEIKSLAQNIISSQQKEIEEMKSMRSSWYRK